MYDTYRENLPQLSCLPSKDMLSTPTYLINKHLIELHAFIQGGNPIYLVIYFSNAMICFEVGGSGGLWNPAVVLLIKCSLLCDREIMSCI